MGSSQSYRDFIPEDEKPEFEQLSTYASVVSFQGYRSAMEDAYDAILDTRHGDLYAVYDGHGGKDAVTFAKENLLRELVAMDRGFDLL
jgi:serine/threonine protein phosphatase PrpC